MKFFYSVAISVLLTVILINCSADNTDKNPVNTQKVVIDDTAPESIAKTSICPDRDKYDVVVMDADRWEILLNLNRMRYQCNSYTGHLWYQAGPYTFKGAATAVYNHKLDMLTVTALDSGWDTGHIVYGLKFIENTNDMYGSFVYYEFPRRTNGIDAWLVKGQLGAHNVVPSTLSKSVFNTPPAEHPKKKRFEMEIDD